MNSLEQFSAVLLLTYGSSLQNTSQGKQMTAPVPLTSKLQLDCPKLPPWPDLRHLACSALQCGCIIPLLHSSALAGETVEYKWILKSSISAPPHTYLWTSPCPGWTSIPFFSKNITSHLRIPIRALNRARHSRGLEGKSLQPGCERNETAWRENI